MRKHSNIASPTPSVSAGTLEQLALLQWAMDALSPRSHHHVSSKVHSTVAPGPFLPRQVASLPVLLFMSFFMGTRCATNWHLASGDVSSSTTVLDTLLIHASSIVPLWEHPAPRATISPLTSLDHPHDVWEGQTLLLEDGFARAAFRRIVGKLLLFGSFLLKRCPVQGPGRHPRIHCVPNLLKGSITPFFRRHAG